LARWVEFPRGGARGDPCAIEADGVDGATFMRAYAPEQIREGARDEGGGLRSSEDEVDQFLESSFETWSTTSPAGHEFIDADGIRFRMAM
jgi:hypothetical protein